MGERFQSANNDRPPLLFTPTQQHTPKGIHHMKKYSPIKQPPPPMPRRRVWWKRFWPFREVVQLRAENDQLRRNFFEFDSQRKLFNLMVSMHHDESEWDKHRAELRRVAVLCIKLKVALETARLHIIHHHEASAGFVRVGAVCPVCVRDGEELEMNSIARALHADTEAMTNALSEFQAEGLQHAMDIVSEYQKRFPTPEIAAIIQSIEDAIVAKTKWP